MLSDLATRKGRGAFGTVATSKRDDCQNPLKEGSCEPSLPPSARRNYHTNFVEIPKSVSSFITLG